MLTNLYQLTSEHPVVSTTVAATGIVALYYLLYVRQGNNRDSSKNEILKLTHQGPEFQIVKTIEALSDFAQRKQPSGSKQMTTTNNGIPRFFFPKDLVNEFFEQQEIINALLPIQETREAVKQILIDMSNEAQTLEQRRKESFDDNNPSHIDLLKRLWRAGINNNSENEANDLEFERTSPLWDRLGFQGVDPATDLRGGGMLALDIFVDFVESNPELIKGMQEHCKKQHEIGGMNWMLIACASINITVTLFFRQQINASSVVYGWTRPILMAMMRGSAIMKFHPRAKISDRDRAGYMPSPADYETGLVRVALPKKNDESIDDDDDKINDCMTAGGEEEQVKEERNSTGLSNNELKSEIKGGMEKQWTLFKSVCRVHHYLMRTLFTEWVLKEASVMQFEQFILKNVYQPFFEMKETVVL
jgi:hypothetical protein